MKEMNREQIQEHFEFYELSSMKRQQANAQVCRQLLAAMDENERLVARFAKLETIGCTCGDGDCEAGDCYGCRGQMVRILREEVDELRGNLKRS